MINIDLGTSKHKVHVQFYTNLTFACTKKTSTLLNYLPVKTLHRYITFIFKAKVSLVLWSHIIPCQTINIHSYLLQWHLLCFNIQVEYKSQMLPVQENTFLLSTCCLLVLFLYLVLYTYFFFIRKLTAKKFIVCLAFGYSIQSVFFMWWVHAPQSVNTVCELLYIKIHKKTWF